MSKYDNCAGVRQVALDDPDALTRDQLKALLGWPHADPCVTREMMVVAVRNRIALGRLSIDDVAAA